MQNLTKDKPFNLSHPEHMNKTLIENQGTLGSSEKSPLIVNPDSRESPVKPTQILVKSSRKLLHPQSDEDTYNFKAKSFAIKHLL